MITCTHTHTHTHTQERKVQNLPVGVADVLEAIAGTKLDDFTLSVLWATISGMREGNIIYEMYRHVLSLRG